VTRIAVPADQLVNVNVPGTSMYAVAVLTFFYTKNSTF